METRKALNARKAFTVALVVTTLLSGVASVFVFIPQVKATIFFSDNFESGTLLTSDTPAGAWDASGGSPAISTSYVADGIYSVLLQVDYDRLHKDFSGVSEAYFAINITFPTTFTIGCEQDVNYLGASGNPSTGVLYLSVGKYADGQTYWAVTNGVTYAKYEVNATVNPQQRYFVEVHAKISSTDGILELYVDGSRLINKIAENTGTALIDHAQVINCLEIGAIIPEYIDTCVISSNYIEIGTTTYTLPSGLTNIFSDDFETGAFNMTKWDLTNKTGIWACNPPNITSLYARGSYSANLTGMFYAIPASQQAGYSVYGDNPWVQINATDVWTQQWVFVPAFVSPLPWETAFSCLTNNVAFDQWFLGVLVTGSTENVTIHYMSLSATQTVVTSFVFPVNQWVQVTTHSNVSDIGQANGVAQVWVGNQSVFNLANLNNTYDSVGNRNIIGTYEAFVTNYPVSSNMQFCFDDATLYVPTPSIPVNGVPNSGVNGVPWNEITEVNGAPVT